MSGRKLRKTFLSSLINVCGFVEMWRLRYTVLSIIIFNVHKKPSIKINVENHPQIHVPHAVRAPRRKMSDTKQNVGQIRGDFERRNRQDGPSFNGAGLHSCGVDMWTKKQAMGTIEKNPKSKFIGVRLTADEYETLRARMSEDGYLAISRFVLDCTIRRRSTGRPVKAEEYADLVASIKKSTSAINKWGSLYNQTVKALNGIAAGVPANEVPKILTLMEKQKRLAALVRADQERINDAVEKMLSIAK